MVEFNINQIDGATCRHRQARGRKCILLARGVAMVTQALSLSTRVSRVKNRAQGCQCGPRASRDRPICKFPSSKDGSQKPEGRRQDLPSRRRLASWRERCTRSGIPCCRCRGCRRRPGCARPCWDPRRTAAGCLPRPQRPGAAVESTRPHRQRHLLPTSVT